ncbi:MAG: EAL domain-containing protein [Hyphomonadaceae bacterium]
MFRRLRVKLTVLYAGLFCAALALIGATAYAMIAQNTQRLAQAQLMTTDAVFQRMLQLRLNHLHGAAQSVASDDNVHHALHGGDAVAARIMLERLRVQARADFAFVVTREGLVISEGSVNVTSVPPGLQAALAHDNAPSGLMQMDGLALTAVAPILGGDHGWVVVGSHLDESSLRDLERVSSIPLTASAPTRGSEGWEIGEGDDRAAFTEFLDAAVSDDTDAPQRLTLNEGPFIALARLLPSIDGTRNVLLLRYELSSALSPYRALFNTLLAIGIVGIVLLVAGTWFLARSITQPLSTLEEAARKLQQGAYETVVVRTHDELARLADSFNAMIGAIQERERRITQLAYQDGESRLPNRLALERRLAGAKQPERLYLAAIGIERFAHVRGAIGYALAGALIRTLGARLARLAPNAPIGRLSTDVLGAAFLAEDEADARRRAEAFVANLEEVLPLEGHDIDIHVSIGVAQPRGKDESLARMIERASIALDQARSAGQKVGFFDRAAYGDPARNLSLMGEMRRALESGAIHLAHQPKYDYRTGRIASAECLVRWRHPTRGMIAPDLFVPMAEETGHIRALTEWVLERAIADQKQLVAAGKPLALSVNISGRLLSDADFARRALELAAQAPHQLCFEITETAIIDNPPLAIENIERFAAAGIHIAIDDYGAGLSSLAYLKQLRAHELKIDKIFIQTIDNSQRDALLVASTIDLAHGLGMAVTAEGVETPAAFTLLASMQCDLAQGYLVARPASLEELIALLNDERRLRFYQQTAAGVTPRPSPATSSQRIA